MAQGTLNIEGEELTFEAVTDWVTLTLGTNIELVGGAAEGDPPRVRREGKIIRFAGVCQVSPAGGELAAASTILTNTETTWRPADIVPHPWCAESSTSVAITKLLIEPSGALKNAVKLTKEAEISLHGVTFAIE
jgi:hypothetical protein